MLLRALLNDFTSFIKVEHPLQAEQALLVRQAGRPVGGGGWERDGDGAVMKMAGAPRQDKQRQI